jgi:AraC-like DNA-binding protein
MIRAGAATGVLEAVASRGGSPERVLRSAGLRGAELGDPDRLVDLARLNALYEAAARETGDTAFGLHLGLAWDLGRLGTLSYAVLNAPTVGIGLHNLARYSGANLQAGRIGLVVRGREVRVSYELNAEPELCRQHAEGAAVLICRVLRRLVGDTWRPVQVLFGHRHPPDVSEHGRAFGAPIHFGVGANATIVLDAVHLEQAVPGADRLLLPIVERHLDRVLATAAGDVWLVQVRNAIAQTLCDGSPRIRTIAKRLAMSVRTLQRRLDERGVVFTALVAEIRSALAHRYLADPRADLTEVALLLGYSDLSAFDRAFRRWTGSTPLEARAGLIR